MATKKKLLQAAAGNAGGAGLDVDDVFSTYLYTGTGSTQTITNDIDLAGEGGLVWTKSRSDAYSDHLLFDTERGALQALYSHQNNASENFAQTLTSFNSNGFSVGTNDFINKSSSDLVSWSFLKSKRFFDIQTYTGNGTAGRTVSHNLGSVAGCIIVKRTDSANAWNVYHRGISSDAETDYLVLSSSAAAVDDAEKWNDTAPTSTEFTVGNASTTNASGGTYVAYLFAHNDGDGEFGPDGDQDIIKCGSWTASQPSTVTLGFEPQWLLVKRTDGTGNWFLVDNMRGADFSAYKNLSPNLSNAEGTQAGETFTFNPDGFTYNGSVLGGGNTCIYIAIRRPTAVPESATEVFDIDVSTASQPYSVTTSLNYVDATINRVRTSGQAFLHNRLTGSKWMFTDSTNAESNSPNDVKYDFNGKVMPYYYTSGDSHVNYMWKRAPNYMDCVAYSGTGTSNQTLKHNLGVVPEMMWVKRRNGGSSWLVYHKGLNVNGDGRPETDTIDFTNSAAFDYLNAWFDTAPTDTEFTVGTYNNVTNNGNTFIAYLFATLAGISKVGSATHSGTTNVDCGFSSGARFVLLKRTDATGDWYIWDSERGIVSGNDPYLLLNSTAAEVTNTDYIDPLSSGFTITSSFTGGDYIFYAIA